MAGPVGVGALHGDEGGQAQGLGVAAGLVECVVQQGGGQALAGVGGGDGDVVQVEAVGGGVGCGGGAVVPLRGVGAVPGQDNNLTDRKSVV